MKRSQLHKLVQLIRKIDEYHMFVHSAINLKRYLYIVIFTFPLIIACLSYGKFIDVGNAFYISGNEGWISVFCFLNIAASVYVLALKGSYHSLKDYRDYKNSDAEKEIKTLKKDYKGIVTGSFKNVAGNISMVLSILVVTGLTVVKNGKLTNPFSTDIHANFAIISWSLLVISFTIGDTLKMYFLRRNRKRKRGVEINVRNVFIDNLSVSKINPDLNE